MTQPEQQHALDKAKVALMQSPDSAFFTALAFGMRHQFNDKIPTARTDGLRVEYNPTFFMNLSAQERVFLILHEALHGALLHMLRAVSFDKRRYNIAADHVINLMLIERGFEMPACGVADPQYKGMSTEEVYKLLPDCPEPPPNGIGDDLADSDELDTNLSKEMEEVLVRAAIHSQMRGEKPGTIPEEIQIFLNRLLKPKLPWNQILAKYLNGFKKNDYTFRRPNRRFMPEHYMPSMLSESLTSLAVAVDTSGSVSDDDFHRFVSETHSIIRMMQPEQISFIQFDTEIKSVNTVKSIKDLMTLDFSGRGGTDVTEVLEWASTNKPNVLLIFTDGEFDLPNITPKTNVVWLIHGDQNWTAPFGKVIHYEV